MIIHLINDNDRGEGISKIDLSKRIEISIPLDFNSNQPNAYGAPPAKGEAYKAGSFIGSVAEGGACNCFEYKIIPHCNGTHTENVSHILNEITPINQSLTPDYIKVKLIDIEVLFPNEVNEKYEPKQENNDKIISKAKLFEKLSEISKLDGLIIRTLPNPISKKSLQYSNNDSPYLTNDAMEYLVDLGVTTLLVDFPSVDRADDDGKLSNHRIFFREDLNRIKNKQIPLSSITEMIYVNDDILESDYWLQIQIPSFVSDAAPSRVFIFKEMK